MSDGLMECLPVLTGYQISTRKLKEMTHTFMANLGERGREGEREGERGGEEKMEHGWRTS